MQCVSINNKNSKKIFQYDGIISNCTGGAGGAVGLNGANVMFGSSEGPVSFYMYGGEIINCTDTDEDLGGGAVWVCTNTSPVTVVIQDGKITGCKGHMGGAILYYAAHEDASLRIEGGDVELCGGGNPGCSGCHKRRIMEQYAKPKGDAIMRIAVTYENGEIFQHFGHTEQFGLYDVEDGKIVSSEVVDTAGSGHGALAGMLSALHVDALICGGIGGGAQQALAAAGIRLYAGVTGSADAAAQALAEGKLACNANATCSHHGEHHEGSCGSHGCGHHSCGEK